MPDPDATIRSHNVDFKKLDLDIKFTPEDGKLEGVAVYLFNAIQVKVDSVFRWTRNYHSKYHLK